MGEAYSCGNCGASGVKLWRYYQAFLDVRELKCFACALVDQAKNVDWPLTGDQIGWLVPAVSAPDGSFWGYTSAADGDVNRWMALPSRALTAAETPPPPPRR